MEAVSPGLVQTGEPLMEYARRTGVDLWNRIADQEKETFYFGTGWLRTLGLYDPTKLRVTDAEFMGDGVFWWSVEGRIDGSTVIWARDKARSTGETRWRCILPDYGRAISFPRFTQLQPGEPTQRSSRRSTDARTRRFGGVSTRSTLSITRTSGGWTSG